MQFPPFSRHLIPLRSKYPPQHPVLKHPQSMFLPECRDQVSRPYRTTGKIIVLKVVWLQNKYTLPMGSIWENHGVGTLCRKSRITNIYVYIKETLAF
jgi:hypothetical protein